MRMRFTILFLFLTLVACGQKDDTFNKPMFFNYGLTTTEITFPDGTSLKTAPAGVSAEWDSILNKPDFATVATTGDYNDLDNRPQEIDPAVILEQYGYYSGKTTEELDSIVPPKGYGIAFDLTVGKWKVYQDGQWETLITDK